MSLRILSGSSSGLIWGSDDGKEVIDDTPINGDRWTRVSAALSLKGK